MIFRTASLAILAFSLVTARADAHPGRGIQVDSRGRVWFVDTARDILWRLDGGVLTPVRRGVHSDRLFLVGDSAVTAEEYFATTVGPRLARLAADSTNPRHTDAVHLAADTLSLVAVDASGNAYFVFAGRALVLTPTDSIVQRAHGLGGEHALAAATRPDGWLYLVIENRVWEIPTLSTGMPAVTDSTTFKLVSGVAAGDSARVCIADYLGRRVYLYLGDKGITRGTRWYPVGVAIGPDGACYALERRFQYGGVAGALDWASGLLGTPRVRRIDPAGLTEVVTVVRRGGMLVPILTLALAAVVAALLWRRARRRAQPAA